MPDAILDAYILLPIYYAVRREYDLGIWPLFSTSAFAFNVDVVENGTRVRGRGLCCALTGF